VKLNNVGEQQMIKDEWLVCSDIEQMLACLVEMKYPDAEPCNWKQGERKKRLFVYACLSRIWNHLPDEYRKVFESLLPDVDAQISDQTRQAIWSAAENLRSQYDNLLFAVGYDDIGLLSYLTARIAAETDKENSGDPEWLESRRQLEQQAHASLLRDIFGNPFNPVSVNPAWLTPHVVKLAQDIHDQCGYSRMPELANTLADAGCTNADILSHCRQPGVHVRGCWVVDLILGKE
jgi:hypothetical protein